MYRQSRPSALALVLVSSLLGCNEPGEGDDESVPPEFNGVYVNCIGNGQQWATWTATGWAVTSADVLQTCIGTVNIRGADDAPFTFEEWDMSTNSFPAYHDQIAALCEHKCWQSNQDVQSGTENANGVCGASGWYTNVAEPYWDPDDGYNCYTWYADEGTTHDPFASTINWSEGGAPLSLPLECSLLDECHAKFDGDIGQWTQGWEYGGEVGPVAPMERAADYYATTSVTTLLSLDMSAGEGPGHDDAEVLDGYAEYSASDCSGPTCPFYLASLSASNDADGWDVWVTLADFFSEPNHIENVRIDARHASLGAWRPSTGQVAFLPGTLVLDVSFDVSSDCSTCSGIGDDHYDLVLRNDEVVFGEFSAQGFVLEQAFSVVGGEATLKLQLEAQEGPPRAATSLRDQVTCDHADGYRIAAADSVSTDPDGDIDTQMWVVDGIAVPNGTILSVGTHDVALGVVDDRGAWDFTEEQKVEVVRGRMCI